VLIGKQLDESILLTFWVIAKETDFAIRGDNHLKPKTNKKKNFQDWNDSFAYPTYYVPVLNLLEQLLWSN
jgi:hypothetical protein